MGGLRRELARGVDRVPALSEARWQRQVLTLARLHGWWTYHVQDSRRSAPGWPDLVLLRPPSVLLVELKTDHGRLSAAQRQVLDALATCGLEVHVWRPRDLPVIGRRLAEGRSRLENHSDARAAGSSPSTS